jgi:hypothetical protein
MLAILRDGIVNFLENALAKNWIFAEDRNWVFSFENICETMGLDPDYVRGGLLRWSAKALGASRAPKRISDEVFGDNRHSLIGAQRK